MPVKSGVIVLDQTPFYGESGGQVGDCGVLTLKMALEFDVRDTQKASGAFLHHGPGMHLGLCQQRR